MNPNSLFCFIDADTKISDDYLTRINQSYKKYNWNVISRECRDLNLWAQKEIRKELDIPIVSEERFIGQMTSFEFPFKDVINDQIRFYHKYKIQIPFLKWEDKTFFRISIQAYNNKEDVYRLIQALKGFSQK